MNELDKHTNRYLNEHFLHYDSEFNFGSAIDCIKKANGWDDFTYLSNAINETFTGDQQQYLKFMMWDKQYGRNGK